MGKINKFFYQIKNRLKPRNKKYRKESFGSIGNGTIINQNSKLVPQNMYLEDNIIIQNGVNFISFRGRLFIKKYSVISSGCIIVPSRHVPSVGVPFYYATKYHIGDSDSDIHIEEDCWIGAGSILLPGITIGRGAIVGAGSVVTKNVPPYSVVVGTPAKIISVKFSFNDIVSHEKFLYKETERLSLKYLKDLFNTTYKPLPISNKTEISEQEKCFLRNMLNHEE